MAEEGAESLVLLASFFELAVKHIKVSKLPTGNRDLPSVFLPSESRRGAGSGSSHRAGCDLNSGGSQ